MTRGFPGRDPPPGIPKTRQLRHAARAYGTYMTKDDLNHLEGLGERIIELRGYL
ncbi:MAG: hypothetical protein ACOC8K_03425 [Gemmatimonadota bacterium]